MVRMVGALIVLCLAPQVAHAAGVTLGKESITLLPPTGYCEMDESQPGDARMYGAVRGMLGATGNRLLMMAADCAQLDPWRKGSRKLIDNMIQYQTLEAMMKPEASYPSEAVKQACEEIRAQGEKLVADDQPRVKAQAEKVMSSVKVGEMKFLGVVGEEPGVCYAAVLQKFKAESGIDKTQVNLFAMLLLKGKVIYYYIMAPYESGDTVLQMLDKHKVNVARLRAAN